MAENSRKNEFFERESIAIIAITTSSSIRVNGTLEKQYRREESDCITSEMRHSKRQSVDFVIGLIIFSPVLLFFYS